MQATPKEKLLEFAKEKKLLRPSDFVEVKGARVLISRLVESGELITIGRGLYSLPVVISMSSKACWKPRALYPKVGSACFRRCAFTI